MATFEGRNSCCYRCFLITFVHPAENKLNTCKINKTIGKVRKRLNPNFILKITATLKHGQKHQSRIICKLNGITAFSLLVQLGAVKKTASFLESVFSNYTMHGNVNSASSSRMPTLCSLGHFDFVCLHFH